MSIRFIVPTSAAGLAGALLSLSLLLGAAPAAAQADKVAHGLALQAARAKFVVVKAKKAFYTQRWNLSRLPDYRPRQQVSGTIRMSGSNYIQDSNLGKFWEEGFRKYQPGVRFAFNMKTTLAAVPALVFGVADIGVGRKITFAEQLLYERYRNRDPLTITAATGSYNVTGWQPGYGIVVSRQNPLTCLSLQQLDGIFGAQRTGGWKGTSWHPEWARGPQENIRTWGQLGLTGDWAHHEINAYGLTLRYHQATEMSDAILKGSDKWNERVRIYANYVTRDGKLGRGLKADLAKDRYGIAWIAAPTYHLPPQLKVLAVSRRTGGRCVPYTLETVRDRTYPLISQIYMFANRGKDGSVKPLVREFLRYVVSRQGQEAVERDGKYLPLTAKVARRQLAKLH
ncbi:MAG: phosphate ABC transporter substrate-binding protein [Proteobacteria bacterium]|nr:phosphate ABC transporter substrate-binding protein [Pseudomonadota bacterium]